LVLKILLLLPLPLLLIYIYHTRRRTYAYSVFLDAHCQFFLVIWQITRKLDHRKLGLVTELNGVQFTMGESLEPRDLVEQVDAEAFKLTAETMNTLRVYAIISDFVYFESPVLASVNSIDNRR